MKRFYLIHQSAWGSPAQFAYRNGSLSDAFEGKGCCWTDLAGGYRLVSGDFKGEDRESAWNSHEAVVHLHHPVKEKTLPLGDLLTPAHAHKRFKSEHLDLLKQAVGATETDTLETLNDKVAAVHPGCIIYTIAKKTSRWIY